MNVHRCVLTITKYNTNPGKKKTPLIAFWYCYCKLKLYTSLSSFFLDNIRISDIAMIDFSNSIPPPVSLSLVPTSQTHLNHTAFVTSEPSVVY